jgi:hypothetical protein
MTAHLLVAALFGFAVSASAQTVYRCDTAGTITYTNRPCAQGSATRIELEANPPAESVKLAAARLQTAVAHFNARHPVHVSGAGLLPSKSESARDRPLAENGRSDDSAWCITRNGDGELVSNDRRNANLLVSIRRSR